MGNQPLITKGIMFCTEVSLHQITWQDCVINMCNWIHFDLCDKKPPANIHENVSCKKSGLKHELVQAINTITFLLKFLPSYISLYALALDIFWFSYYNFLIIYWKIKNTRLTINCRWIWPLDGAPDNITWNNVITSNCHEWLFYPLKESLWSSEFPS